jgi:hypothetical protein
MSAKYKFNDKEGVYFVTATVVDWIDVFTSDIYRNILLDRLRFCQKSQDLMNEKVVRYKANEGKIKKQFTSIHTS